MTFIIRSLVFALSFVATTKAPAALVWDYSPDATGASITEDYIGPFFNREDLQYFAEIVRFPDAVRLLGMDVYRPVSDATPEEVTIRIWPDADGSPASDFVEFRAAVTIIDFDGVATLPGFQRVNAMFETPLTLAADTVFWIGMSGFQESLGQLTLNENAPGDSSVFVFETRNNLAFLTGPHIGDMAFRLHGETVVPLPGTAALLSCALIALAAARTRTRTSVRRMDCGTDVGWADAGSPTLATYQRRE